MTFRRINRYHILDHCHRLSKLFIYELDNMSGIILENIIGFVTGHFIQSPPPSSVNSHISVITLFSLQMGLNGIDVRLGCFSKGDVTLRKCDDTLS